MKKNRYDVLHDPELAARLAATDNVRAWSEGNETRQKMWRTGDLLGVKPGLEELDAEFDDLKRYQQSLRSDITTRLRWLKKGKRGLASVMSDVCYYLAQLEMVQKEWELWKKKVRAALPAKQGYPEDWQEMR